MAGINKSIILGNVGQDPEVTYSQSGTCFARISVATSEKWKDKQTGEQKEKTEWHSIKFYGKLAEVVGQYVKKGSKVYIEGKNRCEKYQDSQTGQDKYSYFIQAFEMQMLDSREGGQAPQQGVYQQQASAAPTAQQPQHAPQQQTQYANQNAQSNAPQGHGGFQNQQPPQAPAGMDFDDGIPFMNPYKFTYLAV
jgi:single-strand DNA-binding protein